MNRFWNWKTRNDAGSETTERVLMLNGTIAEETWWDDEISPAVFRSELMAGEGPVTVWINSPGGDCIAAAQIYNMLKEYSGPVTVKIDGIAASAATVVAMAGSRVLVSPVSMMMIHNPATIAAGDAAEMKKAIAVLSEFKESILNAYEEKTGLERGKLSKLMDAETWMNANKAIELGFADGLLDRAEATNMEQPNVSMSFSDRAVTNALTDRIKKHEKKDEVKAAELYARLSALKNHI